MTERRWTTRSMVVAVILATLLGVAGTAMAHDGRLDLALQNLEKTSLLIQAADDVPQLDDKTERTYSRHLRKAVDAIADATESINDAIAVADAP